MSGENKVAQSVVAASAKSVGVAIVLTVLFGALGMFYSTVWGAITMTVISVTAGALASGLGLFVTWIISVVWGAIAAYSYNKKQFSQVE